MKLGLILWLAHVLPQPVADPMCLATTVYLEARGQPELGQRAIAEVTLRRRDSGVWGNSVCSVVLAPGQFAMSLLAPEARLVEPAAAFTAIRIAISSEWNWMMAGGRLHPIVPGANSFGLRFQALDPTATRPRMVARIGNQTFYHSATLTRR